MNGHLRTTAELRRCPECGQALPANWDWDVRALVWMHDQPRSISPTNNDLEIHDGVNGRNRFLRIEFKPDGKALQTGQKWAMEGLSKIDQYTVLLVRGKRVDAIRVERVYRGAWEAVIPTTCESLNTAIIRWLGGALWRDASTGLAGAARRINVPDGRPGHTHGWDIVRDTWTCVSDYYAVGVRPDTGCGETWPAA